MIVGLAADCGNSGDGMIAMTAVQYGGGAYVIMCPAELFNLWRPKNASGAKLAIAVIFVPNYRWI
jgi:hypothetical protein